MIRRLTGYETSKYNNCLSTIFFLHLQGLSAAKWLQEWGVHNILILEARDRVGGRTLTKKVGNSSQYFPLFKVLFLITIEFNQFFN